MTAAVPGPTAVPASTAAVPASDLDLFARETLADPYPAYARLRDAGPVVWLERHRVWAFARHSAVRSALQDHERFYSSAGTGYTDLRGGSAWRSRSQLQEADPPEHTRARQVIASVFSSSVGRDLRGATQAAARRLVRDALARGEVDGVGALAQALPLTVFADGLGVPREGRAEFLPAFAETAFNLNGPPGELFDQAMGRARTVMPWIDEHLYPEKLSPDGWGAQIHERALADGFTREQAAVLVRGILVAGMDTTTKGLAALLMYLAADPGLYAALRDDPRLIRVALDEAVRLETPIQMFFRTASRAVDVDGVTVGAGDRVVLLFGAAGRDPRRWEEPERFDLTRGPAGSLAFGFGIHACLGRVFAYGQAEALVGALQRASAALAPAGPARWRLNNTLRGLGELPLRLTTTA
ncbi:putative 4-methoxybenzoate monooxygenase (O-demethylating) [Frankia canadensis]|uniref:Putative 4-methoxybenzoate monooxygenase (O-demethylating) n=1 Tax=Frankia canadensis TaxID=1836972 RepID=A0A2I2KS47_9ACTN|nr:cytochrome P450 [Frankia canadensis]SNQ48493.1 putative 4-methoxybenzoate monooxygenase (O-demethylating) [Frankia canadensis]SOU55783.1 putative 4-methoxybenzoate monooxygenase (O-demethylating) [Frankia canadensis]